MSGHEAIKIYQVCGGATESLQGKLGAAGETILAAKSNFT